MNVWTLMLAFAAVLPATATASPPQPIDVTVDCDRPALPTQHDVSRLTGIDNFTQAYDTRVRLMAEAHRACQADGVEKVLLVWERFPKPARAVAVAQR